MIDDWRAGEPTVQTSVRLIAEVYGLTLEKAAELREKALKWQEEKTTDD